MTTIRAAITQTTWTGDQASMLDKHEQFARGAAAEGAQVVCFQELFYGPYFGITQDKKYYGYAEPVDGPIVQRFAAVAKELGTVMVLPIYEEAQTGVYYNTRSEEHTSELQSLMRISYAVICLKKKIQ